MDRSILQEIQITKGRKGVVMQRRLVSRDKRKGVEPEVTGVSLMMFQWEEAWVARI